MQKRDLTSKELILLLPIILMIGWVVGSIIFGLFITVYSIAIGFIIFAFLIYVFFLYQKSIKGTKDKLNIIDYFIIASLICLCVFFILLYFLK